MRQIGLTSLEKSRIKVTLSHDLCFAVLFLFSFFFFLFYFLFSCTLNLFVGASVVLLFCTTLDVLDLMSIAQELGMVEIGFAFIVGGSTTNVAEVAAVVDFNPEATLHGLLAISFTSKNEESPEYIKFLENHRILTKKMFEVELT